MLGQRDVQATVAVRSLEAARPFYEEVLGLKPVGGSEMGVQAYRAGSVVVQVYQSEFAGTNKATVLTWSLGDAFNDVMRYLQSKGVAFEHYELPGLTLEGDVHVHGDMRVAWFKDPDGNILSIGNYAAEG